MAAGGDGASVALSDECNPDDDDDDALGAGTFWTTFATTMGAADTALERLLQAPDCTVEALLDQEDVIQEFKACNERLSARLCAPDAVATLIEFITCEPPDGASTTRCFRYPFVAVELMTCGADSFIEVIASPENTRLMDLFWDFLQSTPPSEVNAVLAGYFSRTAAAFLSRRREVFARYLRSRSDDALLQRFLERLHLRSLAELFARLLCAEQTQQLVFRLPGLVDKLLVRMADSSPEGADTQEHVALIIMELLAQRDSLCYGEELLDQLASPKAVGLLMGTVVSGRSGAVAAAASILQSLVANACIAPQSVSGGTLGARSPALSPLASPSLALPDPASLDIGAGENVPDDLSSIGSEPLPKAVTSPRSQVSRVDSNRSTPRKPGCNDSLMQSVCVSLPRVRALLDAALGAGPPSLEMAHGPVVPIGSTTLDVVHLLTMLVRSGRDMVLDAVLNEQLLPRCLELFFRHPWSSLLHNAVRELVIEALTGDGSTHRRLALSLLREGGLAERLVAEYGMEWQLREEGKRRSARVGYMGQLHEICCELRRYGARVPEANEALAAVPGWTDDVLPALDATTKVEADPLGGGVREEDRGLASSGAGRGAAPPILASVPSAGPPPAVEAPAPPVELRVRPGEPTGGAGDAPEGAQLGYPPEPEFEPPFEADDELPFFGPGISMPMRPAPHSQEAASAMSWQADFGAGVAPTWPGADNAGISDQHWPPLTPEAGGL